MDKNYSNNLFKILTIGIFSILLFPNLFTTGMFMDGLIYSTISLNLAEDLGTFWKPYYDGLNAGTFYEHPPFFFWIQSFWFKIFGNHFFLERLFGLVILTFSFLLMLKIAQKTIAKEILFLPILFTLFIPKFVWCFGNNMMEIMLVPITLLSFYIFQIRTKKNQWWQLPSIALLFIAFALIKGPVALGILVIPFCFVFNRKLKSTIIDTTFLAIFSAIGLFLILQNNEASNNLETYFNQQILASINGLRPSEYTNNRFFILFGLLQQLLIPMAILLVLWLSTGFQKLNIEKKNLPLVFMALLFSLPFLLFKKQHIYYILPSFPFFILFFITIFQNILVQFFNKLPKKITTAFFYIGFILFILGVILSIFNFNKPNRDIDLQNDVKQIALIVGKNKVSISKELEKNWVLFAFSSRNRLVDFDKNSNNRYLVSKLEVVQQYEKVAIPTTKYHLYKKKYIEK